MGKRKESPREHLLLLVRGLLVQSRGVLILADGLEYSLGCSCGARVIWWTVPRLGRSHVVDSAQAGQVSLSVQCPCGAGVVWWTVPMRCRGCVVDSAYAGQGLCCGQCPRGAVILWWNAQAGQGLCAGQCPCGAGVVWLTVPMRGKVCVVDSAHAW